MTCQANCTCELCSQITIEVPAPIVIGVSVSSGTQETQPPIIIGPGQGGAIGPQGIQGIQGIQGAAAAAVSSSDDIPEGSNNLYFRTNRVAYVHTQGVPSLTWTIPHNLGFFPNLTVQDSSGTIYEGEITYTNSDSLTVSFSSAFSGKAYLS